MANSIKNKDIIYICPSDWQYETNRLHLTALYFSDSNRVLYIEPSASLLSPFQKPSIIKKWFTGLRQHPENENLFICSPGPTFPLQSQTRSLGKKISKISRKIGIQAPIIITTMPHTVNMLKYFSQSKVVYDCIDSQHSFTVEKNSKRKELENRLVRQADLVFTSASAAYRERKRINNNCYMVPNLAQIDRFFVDEKNPPAKPDRKTLEDSGVSPEVAEKLSQSDTAIGYIGGIGDWIDFSLIDYLAEQRPRWHFFMFGPLAVDVSQRPHRSNLYFPGSIKYRAQPVVLQALDVTLCPFINKEFSHEFHALKLYEFLAGGKPVVANQFDNADNFAEQVLIAHHREEFLEHIDTALKKEYRYESEGMLPGIRRMRKEFARENSWLQSIKKMEEILAEKL